MKKISELGKNPLIQDCLFLMINSFDSNFVNNTKEISSLLGISNTSEIIVLNNKEIMNSNGWSAGNERNILK